MAGAKTRVLMVCTGNICRSPTAEGVLRRKLQDAGLASQVLVDSAGTHNFHPGKAPDARSQKHAAQRGYDLAPLRARQVTDEDFERFDLILCNPPYVETGADLPPDVARRIEEVPPAGAGRVVVRAQ